MNASLSSDGTVQTAAPVPSSSPPPSCRSQLLSWRGSGAANQLQAVITDLGNVSQGASSLGSDLTSGADPSADESALQSAAASLQSDTQAAEDNLIPDCVQSGHEAEGAGLADFNNSAVDCENAITEIGSGDYSVAEGNMQAANAAMQSGSTEIGKASADLKPFDSG